MATPPPLPPRELASYIWGGTPPADWEAAFDAGGRDLRDQLDALVPGGLAAHPRILDFGCGSGRLLRQLVRHPAQAAGGEVHGVDLHAPSIAWVREHLCPPCHAEVAPAAPPLAHPDASFDLVAAVSVLSQIADGWEAWLLELRRILRPGGVLIASLMGLDRAPLIAGRPLTDAEVGMSVHGFGRPWAAGGPMVLHSEWWVRAHYGRAFEVLDHRPQALNQLDAVVLRRPAADVAAPTPEALAAPEPGEPRELSAARHDVARLHADHAVLNAAHDAYAAAYAEEARRTAALTAELAAARAAAATVPAGRGRRGRRGR